MRTEAKGGIHSERLRVGGWGQGRTDCGAHGGTRAGNTQKKEKHVHAELSSPCFWVPGNGQLTSSLCPAHLSAEGRVKCMVRGQHPAIN